MHNILIGYVSQNAGVKVLSLTKRWLLPNPIGGVGVSNVSYSKPNKTLAIAQSHRGVGVSNVSYSVSLFILLWYSFQMTELRERARQMSKV